MSDTSVRLRPIRVDDWPAMYEFTQLEESCRYQTWGPDTADETRDYVIGEAALWEAATASRFTYAVVYGDRVVGMATLSVAPHRQGEISYGVHPDVWGRGVATAAARELLRIGFADRRLHRIVATCDPRNVASARVIVKLGMTYEGRLRENLLIRDGWRDSDVYSLLEDEWRAGK